MPKSQNYPFDMNWTPEQLANKRRAVIDGELTHPGLIDLPKGDKMIYASKFEFTCDNCPNKTRCDFVFDPYNTNGDCLASK